MAGPQGIVVDAGHNRPVIDRLDDMVAPPAEQQDWERRTASRLCHSSGASFYVRVRGTTLVACRPPGAIARNSPLTKRRARRSYGRIPASLCALSNCGASPNWALNQSGGLNGRHHFSFAAYQRPDRLEWGALRALHLYRLEPGSARLPTFHAGFEIVTVVIEGCMRRTGTFAPAQPLRPGGAELISTGTGANLGLAAMGDEPANYIEIWVRSSAAARRAQRQSLLVSPVGFKHPVATGPVAASGTLGWRTAAHLHRIIMKPGEALNRRIDDGICAYLAVLRGAIAGNGLSAGADDALALSGPGALTLRADSPSELLLIQTPENA